ncbi:MAG TPA: transposase [Oligoflexus sp.]|uniref:transposase n=1 Tax=Oligoflexus sp. TaxID=1971216 RepID=UPI002D7F8E24|nr:transposase [Oligoflexus sp.]HET9239414.1 transposase [Oligoflexus sp.]
MNRILCDEIKNYLRKKARKLGIKGGETGIVSHLQRAGSALNLNLHFHLLVIDGIYKVDEGQPVFYRIPGIQEHEVARVVDGVSRRVVKYLRKSGKLSPHGEEVCIADQSAAEDLTLSQLKGASISSRIALGPRSGLKVRRIGGSFGYEEEIPKNQGYGCASKNGFSIHAATSIKAHERDRLEQLLRYLGRGPVAHDKISLDQHGNILYELKKSFDGATHVLLSPLEFIEKLAAIIPPPYRHQVNYYGCLSSHSKLRPLIVPRQEIDAGPAEKKRSPDVPLEELPGDHLEEEAKKPSRYIPWAELLKRTFGIDLTVCPHCGGHVQVIAAIIRKEAIQEVLVHMNLPTGPPATKKRSGTEFMYESTA